MDQTLMVHRYSHEKRKKEEEKAAPLAHLHFQQQKFQRFHGISMGEHIEKR